MNQIQSCIFYLLVILLTTLFTGLSVKVDKKFARKIFKYLSILLPSVVAGIRYYVGTDYGLYKKNFYIIINNLKSTRFEDFELGYKALNKFVGMIGAGFPLLMFIMSFFTILFIYKALINEKDNISVSFGMLIYMFLYYQTSLNLVRQSLAISICIYAITCLNKKPKSVFIIYIFIASMFHKSSLICLPILFIKVVFENNKKKIKRYLIFIILILLVFNREIIADIVYFIFKSNYYSGYFLRQTDNSGNFIMYSLKTAPFIICYFISIRNIVSNNNFNLYSNAMLCGYILGILQCFSATQVQRVAFYFTYLSILVIPFSLKNVRKKYYYIYILFIITFVVFLWYYNFFYKCFSETIPYRTIFNL